jgi:hypothetical protein
MALVSLFDFCYFKGERQFVHMHTMQTFGLMEVQFHSFLTSALDGSERSVSLPSRLAPRFLWV